MNFIDWVFVVASVAAIFTGGALLSSWLNRRLIHQVIEKLDETNKKVDHNTKNVKMSREALEDLIRRAAERLARENAERDR